MNINTNRNMNECQHQKDGNVPRHDPTAEEVVSPLHKVTERTIEYHDMETTTLRKPPPTTENLGSMDSLGSMANMGSMGNMGSMSLTLKSNPSKIGNGTTGSASDTTASVSEDATCTKHSNIHKHSHNGNQSHNGNVTNTSRSGNSSSSWAESNTNSSASCSDQNMVTATTAGSNSSGDDRGGTSTFSDRGSLSQSGASGNTLSADVDLDVDLDMDMDAIARSRQRSINGSHLNVLSRELTSSRTAHAHAHAHTNAHTNAHRSSSGSTRQEVAKGHAISMAHAHGSSVSRSHNRQDSSMNRSMNMNINMSMNTTNRENSQTKNCHTHATSSKNRNARSRNNTPNGSSSINGNMTSSRPCPSSSYPNPKTNKYNQNHNLNPSHNHNQNHNPENSKNTQQTQPNPNNAPSSQSQSRSPSENGSDGGYAGSASSNDVFENTSSTSDSVSSNEGRGHERDRRHGRGCGDATSNASKGNSRHDKLDNVGKEQHSNTYTGGMSSSSELADFSSGASDSGDADPSSGDGDGECGTNHSHGHTRNRNHCSSSSRMVSSSLYLIVDSSSDDSEQGLEDTRMATGATATTTWINHKHSVRTGSCKVGKKRRLNHSTGSSGTCNSNSNNIQGERGGGGVKKGGEFITRNHSHNHNHPTPPSQSTTTHLNMVAAKRRKRSSSHIHSHSHSATSASSLKEDRTNTIKRNAAAAGAKTTGLSSSNDENSTNSTKNKTKYTILGSWDYIDRTIQKKITSLAELQRKLMVSSTQQYNYANLQQNYESAMQRYSYPNSVAMGTDANNNMGLSFSESSSSSRKCSSLSSSTNCTLDNANGSRTGPMYSQNTPLYNIGVDIMAKVLSYLKPMEANRVLSEPLSKTFRASFSMPQDVWRILCLSEPFYAVMDKKRSSGSGDDSVSVSSYPICKNVELQHILGRYRLLFSSFVRCVTYLDRIKDDTINGRTPGSEEQPKNAQDERPFRGNSSLERFFARARDVARRESDSDISSSSLSSGSGSKDHGRKQNKKVTNSRKVKYGTSALTRKLLGPVHQSGIAGNVDLPSSCAVYSIVNWMVAFADVAGIQTMCMHVLPILLEDDKQRTTAQNAGLTDIVLRAMVLFPDNAGLHTSAFHTLVLLARPIGGKEGMIFYRAMVNALGIFNIGSSTGKSGIAIMMDSMKRFSSNEDLQAMSCWSMVNIALIQSQKVALVRLGGISAAGNAMMQHPSSPNVQFRAMFALINLVIPSENLPENSLEARAIREQVDGVNKNSEIHMLDESVEYITNLVVVAMKNFCSNTAILNRACLVLHNLSLNDNYHNVLLWTPNCYQMIEWCIENYKQDKVLQQSARGTLQRLQVTLSNDETLQSRFAETIRAQQQSVVDTRSVVFENARLSRSNDDQNEDNE